MNENKHIGEDELLLSQNITSLEILHYEKQLSIQNDQPTKEFYIHARLCNIEFDMKIIVSDERSLEPSILSLFIDTNSIWKLELQPLIDLTIKQKNPVLWLQGVQSFYEEVTHRQEIWNWLRENYSEYIEFPYDEYSSYILVNFDVHHTDSYKLQFKFYWTLNWTIDGVLIPTLKPSFHLHSDDPSINVKDTIAQLSTHFQSILQYKGIKAALLTLLRCGL